MCFKLGCFGSAPRSRRWIFTIHWLEETEIHLMYKDWKDSATFGDADSEIPLILWGVVHIDMMFLSPDENGTKLFFFLFDSPEALASVPKIRIGVSFPSQQKALCWRTRMVYTLFLEILLQKFPFRRPDDSEVRGFCLIYTHIYIYIKHHRHMLAEKYAYKCFQNITGWMSRCKRKHPPVDG